MQSQLLSAALLALLLSFSVSAEEQQSPKMLEAKQILKRNTGDDWIIFYDGDVIRHLETADQNNSNNPEQNYFPVYKHPLTAAPEQAATQFLHAHFALFQLPQDLNTLQITKAEYLGTGSYGVLAQQTYQGVPIFNHGIAVFMNRKTGIFSVGNSYYYENITISLTPKLSVADIGTITRKTYDDYFHGFPDVVKPEYPPATSKLGIKIGEKGQQALIYFVDLGTFIYEIDANSGEVLNSMMMRWGCE